MRHLWKRSKSSSSSNKSRGTDELSSKTMGESSRSMSVGSSDRSMQSSGSFRREALLKKDGTNISKREFKKELKKEMKVIKIARVKSFKARQALTEMGDIDEVSEQARLAEERRRRRSRSASSVGSRRRSDLCSVGSDCDDANATADNTACTSPGGLIPTELTLNMVLQEEEGEDDSSSSRRHHPQGAYVEAEARGIADPSTRHEGEGPLMHANDEEEIAEIAIGDDEQQVDKSLVAAQNSQAEETVAASDVPASEEEAGTEEPVLTCNTNEASVRVGTSTTAEAEQSASECTFDVNKGTEAQQGRQVVRGVTSLPTLEYTSLNMQRQQSADETCTVTDPTREESDLCRKTLREASERKREQQDLQAPVQMAPGAYEINDNDECSAAEDSEGPEADSAAGALVLGGVYLSMNSEKGDLKPKTNKLLSLNPPHRGCATTTDDFSSSASTNTTSLMTHAEHDPFPLLDEPPSSTLSSFWEDDYAELEESTKRLQETIAALNLTLECSQQFEAEQIQEERAKCSAARKEEIAQQIRQEVDEPSVDPKLLQIRQNQEKLIDALQAENKARRKESQALNLQLLSLLNSTVRLEKATEETQVFTQEMERVHIKVHENKHQELMAEMVSCVLEEKSLTQELSKAIWGAKNERRARKAYGMGMDILLAKVQQYYDGNLLKAISELPPVVIMASFAERNNIKKKSSKRGSVLS